MEPQVVTNRLNNLLPTSMRYGHFRYYWTVLFAGVTGHMMLMGFTLGWLVVHGPGLDGDAKDLAFLGLALAIPALLLNIWGGALADRLEPKMLVAFSQTTSATAVTFLAVLVLRENVAIWHVQATGVLIGAAQAFDQPSRSSIFPRLVLREHIVNAVAMENIIWNGVRIFGPILAAFLIQWKGIYASMFFSAATFYVMGMIVPLLRLRERPPASGQVLQQIGEGIQYVRNHSVFALIMLLTFCNSMFGMAYVQLMPIFAKDVLHEGAGKISFLLGAAGVGAIIGTIAMANVKAHQPKGLIILGAAVLYGTALILFSIAAWQVQYELSMVFLFFVGIGNSLYLVGGISTLQLFVPDRLRGRVMGLYGVTWGLGPLGMTQAGLVADLTSAPIAVASGAIVIIIVALVILARSPQMRALRAVMPEVQREAYQPAAAGNDD